MANLDDYELLDFGEDPKEAIFLEVRERERNIRKRREIERRNKIVLAKKAGLTVLLSAGVAFSLVKYCKYLNQPINVVTHDIMANSKLLELDGKKESPKKYKNAEDLYDAINDNNILKIDILNKLLDEIDHEGIDREFALEKIKAKYPELMEGSFLPNISPGEEQVDYGKTK